MEIKLKGIYIISDLTDGTTAFVANLYINKRRAGPAGNLGDGASTFYSPYDEEGARLIRQAEEWCLSATEDSDLEMYIDALLFEHIEKKDRERFRKKMKRAMVDGILFGVPGKQYRVMKYKCAIDELFCFAKGIERLRLDIHNKVLPMLAEGEKILNTNIPAVIVKMLEIDPGKIVDFAKW
jgi:hypothetical protein